MSFEGRDGYCNALFQCCDAMKFSASLTAEQFVPCQARLVMSKRKRGTPATRQLDGEGGFIVAPLLDHLSRAEPEVRPLSAAVD